MDMRDKKQERRQNIEFRSDSGPRTGAAIDYKFNEKQRNEQVQGFNEAHPVTARS
jgi:hypothetical protein